MPYNVCFIFLWTQNCCNKGSLLKKKSIKNVNIVSIFGIKKLLILRNLNFKIWYYYIKIVPVFQRYILKYLKMKWYLRFTSRLLNEGEVGEDLL